MFLDVDQVRVTVLGPPDLLTTAIVAGLSAHGIDVERLPLHAAVLNGDGPDQHRLGVLLVDLELPHAELVIRQAHGLGLAVLALSPDGSRDRAAAAIAAGATAWVRTSVSIDDLADTVRAAAAGRLRMSPESRAGWSALHRDSVESLRADVDRLAQLTPREREVLGHLAEGRRASEIAGILVLSVATIRSHIHSMLRKLGCSSQQQAVEFHRELAGRRSRSPRLPSSSPSGSAVPRPRPARGGDHPS